jgi:hypothetical protein
LRKGTENGKTSIRRLYQNFLKTAEDNFRNVVQRPVPREAWHDFKGFNRETLNSLLHYDVPSKAKSTIPSYLFDGERHPQANAVPASNALVSVVRVIMHCSLRPGTSQRTRHANHDW